MLFGYQAVYDRDMFDAIDSASENQFDFVSFDLNMPRFYIDQMTRSDLDGKREYAAKKRVAIAFHAPGDNISLYADYPAIRRGILEHFDSIITAAEQIGARHLTLHVGAHPSLKKAGEEDDAFLFEYGEYFATVLYENLMHLAGRTRTVMLCLENFMFTPLTMQAVEKTLRASDRLFLTWDIPKTYDGELRRNASVEEFMVRHASRIREAHVHDFIKGHRQHQIIGQGGIDFAPYAAILRNPEIAVTIEVRPRDAATLSRAALLRVLGIKGQ